MGSTAAAETRMKNKRYTNIVATIRRKAGRKSQALHVGLKTGIVVSKGVSCKAMMVSWSIFENLIPITS